MESFQLGPVALALRVPNHGVCSGHLTAEAAQGPIGSSQEQDGQMRGLGFRQPLQVLSEAPLVMSPAAWDITPEPVSSVKWCA